MRKIIGSSTLAVGTLLLPALVSAQSASAGLQGVLQLVSKLANGAIGLFITIAIVIFFWGLIKYLANAGEEKAAGLSIMFYGVVAIFVMVSIWGLIKLLQNTLGIANQTTMVIPSGVEYQPH